MVTPAAAAPGQLVAIADLRTTGFGLKPGSGGETILEVNRSMLLSSVQPQQATVVWRVQCRRLKKAMLLAVLC